MARSISSGLLPLGFRAMSAARESMKFDVVIVGAGPAGLSAAIKIKQVGRPVSSLHQHVDL
jgi:ribulose 1,5-bisphosphate synthetase/thiazole synthase